MKGMGLAVAQEDCWRNIAITLIDPSHGSQTSRFLPD